MKLKQLTATCILSCSYLFASISYASDWRRINPDRYIDINDMHIVKDYHMAYWIWYEQDADKLGDQAMAIIRKTHKIYSHGITAYEVDCYNKKMRVTDFCMYATDGSVILSESNVGQQFSKVIPDSIGQAEFNYACQVYADQTGSTKKK